jgi:hypothetical protein
VGQTVKAETQNPRPRPLALGYRTWPAVAGRQPGAANDRTAAAKRLSTMFRSLRYRLKTLGID